MLDAWVEFTQAIQEYVCGNYKMFPTRHKICAKSDWLFVRNNFAWILFDGFCVGMCAAYDV